MSIVLDERQTTVAYTVYNDQHYTPSFRESLKKNLRTLTFYTILRNFMTAASNCILSESVC